MYDSAQTESEADRDTSVYKPPTALMKLKLGYELNYEFPLFSQSHQACRLQR